MSEHTIKLVVYMPDVDHAWPEDVSDDVAVVVTFDYRDGFSGSFDEPAYGPEIDVSTVVYVADGKPVSGDVLDHVVNSDRCYLMMKQCAEDERD